jgi:hypothetical protein
MPEAANPPAFARDVWGKYVDIVEKYDEPGRFTALIGYEWTPNPKQGNNPYRSAVYRDGKDKAVQVAPYTTFDSVDPEDLWTWMANYEGKTGGRVLAIPHNGNLSNGTMFALTNMKGSRSPVPMPSPAPAGSRSARSRRSRATARPIPPCLRPTSSPTTRPGTGAT